MRPSSARGAVRTRWPWARWQGSWYVTVSGSEPSGRSASTSSSVTSRERAAARGQELGRRAVGPRNVVQQRVHRGQRRDAPQQTRAPHERLEAPAPIPPQRAENEGEPVGMREDAEDEGLEQPPPQGAPAAALDLRARRLEQRAERHARRARGLARATAETEVEVARVSLGDVEPALRDGAHQIDATARRVHLLAERAVGRTRRQADAAVHARANVVEGGRRGQPVGPRRHHSRPTKRPGLSTPRGSNSVLIARMAARAAAGTGPQGSRRSRRARGARSTVTPPPTSPTVARSRSSGGSSTDTSACVTSARSAPSPAAPATAAPRSEEHTSE